MMCYQNLHDFLCLLDHFYFIFTAVKQKVRDTFPEDTEFRSITLGQFWEHLWGRPRATGDFSSDTDTEISKSLVYPFLFLSVKRTFVVVSLKASAFEIELKVFVILKTFSSGTSYH